MTNTATIEKNLIAVQHTVRADDNTEWLRLDVPNGWDDVKKLCKKVLRYNGHTYTFRSWNSDTLTAAFSRSTLVAEVCAR
jgi:hypothetical protein